MRPVAPVRIRCMAKLGDVGYWRVACRGWRWGQKVGFLEIAKFWGGGDIYSPVSICVSTAVIGIYSYQADV